mmetsp:Transcript_66077/g.196635  ORF Transcript_66077/g.196635 Transcript_66077/m.196635 type:complete len:432 (+) Transcript_66077:518-1813(+)
MRQAHALLPEGGARHGRVQGRASPVPTPAHAVLDLTGASKVRLRARVRDAAARLVRDGLQPLVGTVNSATVAGTDVGAVEDVLHGKLHIRAPGLAHDLDAVAESGDRAVGPAGAAILGDVLIEGGGAVVHAVLVAPAEVRRVATGGNREPQVRGSCRGVAAPDNAESLRLLTRQELALPRGGLRLGHAAARLAVRAILITMDLVVSLGRREVPGHCPSAAPLKCQAAAGDTDEALLTPVLAPTVPHNPVEALLGVSAPAHDRDDVVDEEAEAVPEDTGLVVPNGARIDAAADGTTVEDLLHHALLTGDGPKVRDRGVGVGGEAHAGLSKGAASPGHILRSALPLAVAAETVPALARTGHVGIRGGVGDPTACALGDPVEPLVGAIDGATVAGADVAAVEDVLHRELHVRALGLARDLDAVAEGRHSAMGPA